MVTLPQIKNTLENLDFVDGDCNTVYIDRAIEALQTAKAALNTISVRGRTSIDQLLGCMLALDMILGEGE